MDDLGVHLFQDTSISIHHLPNYLPGYSMFWIPQEHDQTHPRGAKTQWLLHVERYLWPLFTPWEARNSQHQTIL